VCWDATHGEVSEQNHGLAAVLRENLLAPNRAAAEAALNVFAEKYRVK
jgi:hypothetical protein